MSIILRNFPESDSQAIQHILDNLPLTNGQINYAQLVGLIEPYKLVALSELVREYLGAHQHNKVIIVLVRIVNQPRLAELLAEFNPLIIRPTSLRCWNDFITSDTINRIAITSKPLLQVFMNYPLPNSIKFYLTFGLKDNSLKKVQDRLELVYDANHPEETRYTARHYC